jgi:hypothetical protein
MNTVITDKDFEQFIYVNRAAKKRKAKLKKNQPPQDELKDILDEGNITVNQSYELDMLKHRQEAQEVRHIIIIIIILITITIVITITILIITIITTIRPKRSTETVTWRCSLTTGNPSSRMGTWQWLPRPSVTMENL